MRNARCWVSFAVVMLAVSLLSGCRRGGTQSEPAAQADDAKEIEGTWKVVSLVVGGKSLAAPETTLAIGGGKITPLEGPKAGESGQYRLDSTASPKTIDLIDAEGKVARWIYTLAGDELKIRVAGPNAARPTSFDSEDGSPAPLAVLKRQVFVHGLPSTSTLKLTSYSVFACSGSLAMMHAQAWKPLKSACAPVCGSNV